MPELVASVNCPKCGGPLALETGDVIVTCPYCGTASRIRGERPFVLKHGMLLARMDRAGAEAAIAGWFAHGFLKPNDLRKAQLLTLECVYVPFYIFEVDASTSYAGLLTRTGTHERREGNLMRDYFWKVLARRSGEFPVREYKLPLAHKAPFDTSLMVRQSRFLNAEVDEDEAARIARAQVEAHQKELLKDLVDVVERAQTDVLLKDVEFLHAPLWFAEYGYREKVYDIIVDGASGEVVSGEIPLPGGGFADFVRQARGRLFNA